MAGVVELSGRGGGGGGRGDGDKATPSSATPHPPHPAPGAPGPPGAPAPGAATGAPPAARRRPAKATLFQRFAQQDLAGWSPILTPGALVLYFTLAGAACAAIGAPLLAASLSVVQVTARYDDAGPLAALDAPGRAAALAAAGGDGIPLDLVIPIPALMRPPVYVYYELGSFFQNHKRYVRSRDDQQMGGVPGPPAERCAPEKTTPDGQPIVPCGLTAWSLFNDTFTDWTLEAGGGAAAAATPTPLDVDSSSIAWPSDALHLYGPVLPQNFNADPGSRGGGRGGDKTGAPLPLNEDQHLMVWLRPAAAPTVRKLWGVIDTPLPAGSTVRVAVGNRYNTYGWGGPKTVVLTTSTWAGGRNHFLGAAYLAVAGACLLAAGGFALGAGTGCCGLVRRRRYGDPAELSWNRGKQA